MRTQGLDIVDALVIGALTAAVMLMLGPGPGRWWIRPLVGFVVGSLVGYVIYKTKPRYMD